MPKTHRKQRLYAMKGCSTQKCMKGGTNYDAADKTIPNSGPVPSSNTILNPLTLNLNGGCGGTCPVAMSGGSRRRRRRIQRAGCAGMCLAPLLLLGGKRGRKMRRTRRKRRGQRGGNAGIPYPNGLGGAPWTSNPSSWPGVGGVQGASNHYVANSFDNDPTRQMMSERSNMTVPIQKGGNSSNFLMQDLVNLGRVFGNTMGNAYNGLLGYKPMVSPLPYQDQLPRTPAVSTMLRNAL